MTKTREQVARAYAVLDHIERNPDKLDQDFWTWTDDEAADHRGLDLPAVMGSCGTTACYAGWTVLLAGKTVTDGNWIEGEYSTVSATAARLLGLTGREASELFYVAQDLPDVRKAVFEIFGPRPDGAA